MSHPTLLDKLALKINPRYLFYQQTAQITGRVYAGIMHKSPEMKEGWKVMDYIYLEQGSQLRYMGLASKYHLHTEISLSHSLFEIINPVIQTSYTKEQHVSNGDVVCIAPSDRKYIYPLKQ